jgi:hypothetical protein
MHKIAPQTTLSASAKVAENDTVCTETRADERVQVAFRMDKSDYINLKRMALDEDTTVNELLIQAIQLRRQWRRSQD